MKKIISTFLWVFMVFSHSANAHSKLPDVVEQIKPSIVGIAAYNVLRQPQAEVLGTGFVVGDGHHIATNYHVVRPFVKGTDGVKLVVLIGVGSSPEVRDATMVELDQDHDLALLKIGGRALNALNLRQDRIPVREGMGIAITGFPLGPTLGLYPATHKGIVSAVTPNVIPQPNARQLDAVMVRRARFNVYQLDIVAYPGNSGSPVFRAEDGEVFAIVNSAYIKDTKEHSISHPSGITYAIPIKFVSQLLRRAKVNY
ncbi:MAG: serine protease [Sphingomonadales bacterium]|jgi:S1-C subfamily serine protease